MEDAYLEMCCPVSMETGGADGGGTGVLPASIAAILACLRAFLLSFPVTLTCFMSLSRGAVIVPWTLSTATQQLETTPTLAGLE